MKFNNPVLYGAVLVLLFGMLFVFSRSSGMDDQIAETPAASEFSGSMLAAAETSFDFGQIRMQDGKVTHQFEVLNNGKEALTVRKVYTSCMCTVAKVADAAGKVSGPFGMPGHGGASAASDITVPGGEKIFVDAIFDPAAHGPSGVGIAQRSIFLETNSAKNPKLELKFQAVVIR